MSSSNASSELENYQLQLQQVEAALVAEPENEELLKLKDDLCEIINLQKELLLGDTSSSSAITQSSQPIDRINWKVGDRCLAPSKNGQRYVAMIDGISQDKHMVRLSDLSVAPVEEKKNYIFLSNKQNNGPKKEWQLERERRKLRAQKKEQRRKTLEETKEQEKNKWLNFNAKASAKGIKGLKRVEASSSAADGGKLSGSRQVASLSSRKDLQAFGATNRGNMESLF
ncbi:survival of motor neuron-related-splicing factor 30 [Ditylenchus destructor]|uniref:Survival of motor neuron-related-splicing factor 30 n=1 Tax=Ditylenchus destructor TaxID=166010 RepID=A0AAD4N973_9BILA|nr:survival of motor neuron-related-splicing factor 30 [Ditylenchus destructor]